MVTGGSGANGLTNNKKQNNLPKEQNKAPNLYWVYECKVAFDWEIQISDFAIKRKILKQISPPIKLSSGRISIKKSKSRFHGFPFYPSIGKSKKGFAKLFS